MTKLNHMRDLLEDLRYPCCSISLTQEATISSCSRSSSIVGELRFQAITSFLIEFHPFTHVGKVNYNEVTGVWDYRYHTGLVPGLSRYGLFWLRPRTWNCVCMTPSGPSSRIPCLGLWWRLPLEHRYSIKKGIYLGYTKMNLCSKFSLVTWIGVGQDTMILAWSSLKFLIMLAHP